MNPRAIAALAALGFAFGSAACADEEAVSPAPAGGHATSSSSGAGGAEPTPTPVRQVFVRNPLGGPADDLLADGDFELSIVPPDEAGQHGWTAFGNAGSATLLAETGGLCKSGLRCGRIEANRQLFGRGATAPHQLPLRASIWVRPASWLTTPPDAAAPAPCGELADAFVLDCDAFTVKKQLTPAAQPSADGWCELRGEVPGGRTSLCMYVEIGTQELLVDAASLRAAPDLGNPIDVSPITPPAPTRERLARVREFIRSHMPFTRDALPVDPESRGRAARREGAGVE